MDLKNIPYEDKGITSKDHYKSFEKEELSEYDTDCLINIGNLNGKQILKSMKMKITKFENKKVIYLSCYHACGYTEKIFKLYDGFRRIRLNSIHQCLNNSSQKTNRKKIVKEDISPLQREMIINIGKNMSTSSKYILSKPLFVYQKVLDNMYKSIKKKSLFNYFFMK